MAQATMQGVTLYSRSRRRPQDVFELAVSYEGIEIRRPGETTRHLSWDRVSEWEIEQRRGGVLLTLRGGGSVTPLVIPSWSVDELDVILREVTSNVPPSVPAEREVARQPKAQTPPAARPPSSPVVAPKTPSAPAVGAKATPSLARRPQPPRPAAPAPTPAPRPGPKATPPEPAPTRAPTPPARPASAPSRPSPTFEDVVSEQLAPPKPSGPTLDRSKGHPDGVALVWPGEAAPLKEIEETPSLSWPEGVHRPTDPPAEASDFTLPGGQVVKEKETPFVATLPLVAEPPPVEIPVDMTLPLGMTSVKGPVAPEKPPVVEQRVTEMAPTTAPKPVVAPTPTPTRAPTPAPTPSPRAAVAPPPTMAPDPVIPEAPPIFIPPREGVLEEAVPSRVERRQRERREQKVREPRVREPREPKVREPRVREPRVREPEVPREPEVREPKAPRPAGKRSLVKMATTVVLLGALALAVALVLAQSAGMINLPFLGSPA